MRYFGEVARAEGFPVINPDSRLLVVAIQLWHDVVPEAAQLSDDLHRNILVYKLVIFLAVWLEHGLKEAESKIGKGIGCR
jgi:hypothetical protein